MHCIGQTKIVSVITYYCIIMACVVGHMNERWRVNLSVTWIISHFNWTVLAERVLLSVSH